MGKTKIMLLDLNSPDPPELVRVYYNHRFNDEEVIFVEAVRNPGINGTVKRDQLKEAKISLKGI